MSFLGVTQNARSDDVFLAQVVGWELHTSHHRCPLGCGTNTLWNTQHVPLASTHTHTMCHWLEHTGTIYHWLQQALHWPTWPPHTHTMYHWLQQVLHWPIWPPTHIPCTTSFNKHCTDPRDPHTPCTTSFNKHCTDPCDPPHHTLTMYHWLQQALHWPMWPPPPPTTHSPCTTGFNKYCTDPRDPPHTPCTTSFNKYCTDPRDPHTTCTTGFNKHWPMWHRNSPQDVKY